MANIPLPLTPAPASGRSVSDGVNMSEMDELIKGWEEFVYYGYIIEPEAREDAANGES